MPSRERAATSFCSLRTLTSGWSRPVEDPSLSSTAVMSPASVPKALPVSFTAATGCTIRRV